MPSPKNGSIGMLRLVQPDEQPRCGNRRRMTDTVSLV